jgi:quercetin dioxygenase-like cupin family protein
MPVTRRDLLCAASAVVLTLAAGAAARTAPAVMTSSVFHWNDMKAEPTEAGEVRRVFRSITGTLAELECHITTLAPGRASHPPHTHANEEVLIIREGNVEFFFKGAWHPAAVGDVIFLTGTDPHGVRNAGTTPATYHVFAWSHESKGE